MNIYVRFSFVSEHRKMKNVNKATSNWEGKVTFIIFLIYIYHPILG